MDSLARLSSAAAVRCAWCMPGTTRLMLVVCACAATPAGLLHNLNRIAGQPALVLCSTA